jgi:hypothetical protein
MKNEKQKNIKEMKKRYTFTLDPQPVEKVSAVLKKANLTFSGFINIQITEFAKLIDATGWSEKLENMSVSDALMIMGGIAQGVEEDKKEIKALNVKKKKAKLK